MKLKSHRLRANLVVAGFWAMAAVAGCQRPATSRQDSIPVTPPTRPAAGTAREATTTVLIAYDSLGGNTEQMAKAVAEGVVQLPGAVAVLKRVGRVTRDDLVAADGIILGCPTYYANIPGRMKTAIDDWSWKMKVDFTDKAGGAFATGGGQMGGKEHVVISLLLFMINNRMIVAGPLYTDEEGDDIWAETGAGAMTGPIDPGIGKNELDSARRLGERVAQLAIRLKGQPAATGGIRPTRQPWK